MPSKKNLLHCKHHGKLTPDQVVLHKQKDRNPYFKCTLCIKEQRQRHYAKKKDYRSLFVTEEAYQANLARHKEGKRRNREKLTDGIVKEKLKRQIGIKKEQTNKELIETYRAILKIKRELKKSKLSEQLCERS